MIWLGRFGWRDQMSVGYTSDDAGQIYRQVQEMMSRSVQVNEDIVELLGGKLGCPLTSREHLVRAGVGH
jgi:hypothetical protein